MFHFDLSAMVGLAATLVGAWLAHRITTPKDHDRALLLERIALGAAALVVSLNPKADWATLLEETIKQIVTAAGLPTQNGDAIHRAAAAALTSLGRNEGVTL